MKRIMFNDEVCLTRAVIEGYKTMTRRIPSGRFGYWEKVLDAGDISKSEFESCIQLHSLYQVGDIVAVAQRYRDIPEETLHDLFCEAGHCRQEFDTLVRKSPGWTNKMFVKAELMPVQIQFTDIKIERLQDISDEDTLREGVRVSNFSSPQNQYFIDGIKRKGNTLRYKDEQGWHTFKWQTYEKAINCFASLIDKVSGKGTWENNPWVFSYTFKRIR